MTTSTTITHASNDADAELKARHRGMWALGDYPAVAAGTGNAAIPAVPAEAEVVAADLTPELLEAGARLAEQALTAAEGERLTWREAYAEALPWQDASFDTVLSCVGVMFAPHHQRSADEMLRVCRPGGSIGLLSWTPGTARLSATTSRRPTAPPSRPTGDWPATPSGQPPSTASWRSWRSWRTGIPWKGRWTGSTSWSSRAAGRSLARCLNPPPSFWVALLDVASLR